MELIAPSGWRRIDFISDLHLLQQDGATFAAFNEYLQSTTADALFILGDLFEVWVGDDCLAQAGSFERQCAEALLQVSARYPVYIMHGNRDFLMGADLMAACGTQLLDDPTVLIWAQQRWVLTHGDALCLDDKPYQQFRTLVRSAQWQQDFLAQPLAQRIEIARSLRSQSESRKREETQYADVDTEAAIALLQESQSNTMIHGHTHRPATHVLDTERKRYVLSDWDASARPPRLEVMRWTWSGEEGSEATCQRLDAASAATPAR
jgi:UDP-2,3-diacylglucosamine hydrolase